MVPRMMPDGATHEGWRYIDGTLTALGAVRSGAMAKRKRAHVWHPIEHACAALRAYPRISVGPAFQPVRARLGSFWDRLLAMARAEEVFVERFEVLDHAAPVEHGQATGSAGAAHGAAEAWITGQRDQGAA